MKDTLTKEELSFIADLLFHLPKNFASWTTPNVLAERCYKHKEMTWEELKTIAEKVRKLANE